MQYSDTVTATYPPIHVYTILPCVSETIHATREETIHATRDETIHATRDMGYSHLARPKLTEEYSLHMPILESAISIHLLPKQQLALSVHGWSASKYPWIWSL